MTESIFDSIEFNKAKAALISFFSLAATLLSLFFLIVAPIELKSVQDSKSWEKIPVTMLNIEYRPPSFGKGTKHLVFSFLDQTNGTIQTISDVAPGDFPFSIDFFGSKVFDNQKKYISEFETGTQTYALRDSEGRKYFLKSGQSNTMIGILIASIFWLLYVFFYILKNRKTSGQSTKI